MGEPNLLAADDKRDRGGDGDLSRRPIAPASSGLRRGEQLTLFPDEDFTEPRRRRAAGARH